MFRTPWWRWGGAAALSIALVVVLVVAVGANTAQAGALRWRVLPVLMGADRSRTGEVAAVACPTSDVCIALVHGGARGGPLVLRFSPTSRSSSPLVGYPVPRASGTLLSCPAIWTCVIGGGSAIEVTVEGGGIWVSHPAPTGRMLSLQCAAANRCIAESALPGGVSGIEVGDPMTGQWRSVTVGADATALSTPTCTSSGLCIVTGARLFGANLWVYESKDFGRSWTATELPGPPLSSAISSCTTEGACVVASDDLSVDQGGVDASTSFASWHTARISDPHALVVTGILRQPVTISCSSSTCVIVYAQATSPAPSPVLYGRPGRADWRAYSIGDGASRPRVYVTTRNFAIDGHCVIEWDAAVARRGCPT